MMPLVTLFVRSDVTGWTELAGITDRLSEHLQHTTPSIKASPVVLGNN
jgi:hypothetical protein